MIFSITYTRRCKQKPFGWLVRREGQLELIATGACETRQLAAEAAEAVKRLMES